MRETGLRGRLRELAIRFECLKVFVQILLGVAAEGKMQLEVGNWKFGVLLVRRIG